VDPGVLACGVSGRSGICVYAISGVRVYVAGGGKGV